MRYNIVCQLGFLVTSNFLGVVHGQDTLGLSGGYQTLKTKNIDAQIVSGAQVLASLKASGGSFDFLPFDYISKRARNGQYHIGDITFRYRQTSSSQWVSVDSAASRNAVTQTSTGALAASIMNPTLSSNIPLNITREWIDASGDLGLQITLANTGQTPIEIGSLGFPMEFNSIFTDRTPADVQAKCVLSDTNIGIHGGYIQAIPVSGNGAALVVTPIGDTPLEGYRNLNEQSYAGTYYASQTFEGYHEWQVLSKAYADKEWAGKQPWNNPTSRTIQPGQSLKFGLRFSIATSIRDIGAAVKKTGTPYVVGVPGFIVPRDLPATLLITAPSAVSNITSDPAGAFVFSNSSAGLYTLTPSASAWGRVRVTIQYADSKVQTVHYLITKSGPDALADMGRFQTTTQWYNDTSDPFNRAPSVITYDYEAKKVVDQDQRVWIAGLSDEGGAGAWLAAVMKQALQPNADEVAKLESFVNTTLWGKLQDTDHSVRKSLFYYEPSAVPGFKYRTDISWTGWMSWNKAQAVGDISRGYDYVHVVAAYWAMYRVARAYPSLVKTHDWSWYLDSAYNTIIRCVGTNGGGGAGVGYSGFGMMGETVFGEVLADLKREGKSTQANTLTTAMKARATSWNSQDTPFDSEQAWDSTAQEGVYYWTKYFGLTKTTDKALGTVVGFMPTVSHWGYNGCTRRYWDNIYGGKLERIERQIHHYGSGLNSLVALSAFRSNPADIHLLRIGYGGVSGPLSNINSEGFASASFHSWPDTLAWDGYSGDYGPGFVGLALGSATYLVNDTDFGLVAYGGTVATSAGSTIVTPRDPVRRKAYIAPLGLQISIDAGVIQQFSVDLSAKTVSLTLAQLSSAPKAAAAVVWVNTEAGSTNYTVKTSGLSASRGGWAVPLSGDTAVVQIGPQ